MHPDAKLGVKGNRTNAGLYDLIAPQNIRFNGVGEWNRARIVVRGRHVEHWLNGFKTVEYERGTQMWRALVNYSKYVVWPAIRRGAEGPHPAAGSREPGVVPHDQDPGTQTAQRCCGARDASGLLDCQHRSPTCRSHRSPGAGRRAAGSSRRRWPGSAGLIFLPRTYLFGAQTPPSRRITVAQIGCGRMGMEDLRGTMAHDDLCRIVAVCDLDAKRLEAARAEVEQFYRKKGESAVDVKAYRDFREVLARKDIDAVIVTPPDHWHALVAVQAVLAGKDLHVQKPLTYDIAEAIALRDGRAREAAHPADRQPAAVVEAVEHVPDRHRGRAQRPHRTDQGDPHRHRPGPAQGRAAEGAARAGDVRLPDVARAGAAAALHGGPRPPAGGLRAPGLDHRPRTSASA